MQGGGGVKSEMGGKWTLRALELSRWTKAR
jgi:hypothetical protein